MQKASRQAPMATPAVLKLPMRHEFGAADGRTLSVVKDMEREITGDHHNHHQQRSQDRLPGHDQAHDQEQHRHDLLDDGVERVRLDALERNSPFLHRSDDAGDPASVSTIPAADLATSVAVETAMPICA